MQTFKVLFLVGVLFCGEISARKGNIVSGTNSHPNSQYALSNAIKSKNAKEAKRLIAKGYAPGGYEEHMVRRIYLETLAKEIEEISEALKSYNEAKIWAEKANVARDLKDINYNIAKNKKILKEKTKERDTWAGLLKMFKHYRKPHSRLTYSWSHLNPKFKSIFMAILYLKGV